MKYFSLFSGVGGFEIGITNAYAHIPRHQGNEEEATWEGLEGIGDNLHGGHTEHPRCLGFSELDRYASDVLRFHYPENKNYGDITKIDWATVPDFDLLVGGSPCQSFSIAGKRKGFGGASGLFWEYLRCLQEKKPAYFIWENVKGVLSSNHGYDFGNIINAFSEAGYALWWQVLNAKDFGVPQNRERVFVVGVREGSPREVFFERERDQINPGEDAQRNDVAHTLNCGDKHRGSYVQSDEPRLRQVRLESDHTDSRGGADTRLKS
jgi:DNA (cytosine-5)-methyltransferase 1